MAGVVDWEYPEVGRQSWDFIQLLSAIRTYFPSPRYLVTTALPAGEWCLNRFDLPQLASKLDFLNLMGYDFTGNWGSPIMSGHHGIFLTFFSHSLGYCITWQLVLTASCSCASCATWGWRERSGSAISDHARLPGWQDIAGVSGVWVELPRLQ